MEFRLVYDGALHAESRNNTRVPEKHAIRKQFHSQLAKLWDVHPMLKYMKTNIHPESPTLASMRQESGWFADPNTTIMETFARRFTTDKGFRFVPLVNDEYKLVCGLDILFLRRESPGDLIRGGGDIDNRIKTLFDALRVPKGTELPYDATPGPDENPFCCLLEDDKLITDVKITTDRLLRPIKEDERENNVVLVVHVNVKASRPSDYNLPLM